MQTITFKDIVENAVSTHSDNFTPNIPYKITVKCSPGNIIDFCVVSKPLSVNGGIYPNVKKDGNTWIHNGIILLFDKIDKGPHYMTDYPVYEAWITADSYDQLKNKTSAIITRMLGIYHATYDQRVVEAEKAVVALNKQQKELEDYMVTNGLV